MDRLRIELGIICRIGDLGTEFELPDTQELREALAVLQGVCDIEVKRRKRNVRHDFLARKWIDLMALFGGHGTKDGIIGILEEIVDYGRKE